MRPIEWLGLMGMAYLVVSCAMEIIENHRAHRRKLTQLRRARKSPEARNGA